MNFNYGDILTNAWQTIWKHKSILGLLMVPMGVAFLPVLLFMVFVFIMVGSGKTDISETISAVLAFVLILFFVISSIANLAIRSASVSAATLGIVRAERGEGSTKFMDLVRDGVPYFWRILGVTLVVSLTIGLFFTVFFMLAFVLILVTIGMAAICLQPILILLTPLMLLMIGVLEAAQTAVIAEDMGVMAALQHALRVMRAHVWKYLVITLIVYFGSSLLSGFITIPLILPIFFVPFLLESGHEISMQGVALISVLFSCVFFPLMILIYGTSSAFMKTALDLTYLRLTQKTGKQVIFSDA